MHITLCVAITKDGFINKIGQKHAQEWTSKEDQAHFLALTRQYSLQFWGRHTFEDNREQLRFSEVRRRIVFTHSTAQTDAPLGVVYTAEPILKVVQQLEDEGFTRGLLLGGGVLFSQFLELGLVDEAFVTIEPTTFGSGIPFLLQGKTLADFPELELVDSQHLNATGTVLNHYHKL